jgi:hypothetical protein
MGAAAEVFKIVGFIGLQNVDKTLKALDALDAKANKTAANLGNLAKKIDAAGLKLSRALTVPLAAAGAAIGKLALSTGNYADKILSLQQSTGLSTDTLQEFAHVATAAGGSSDALFATITKLTGKLPDIAAGSGKTAEAFHELGINALDASGNYRNMEELFPDIIKGLQGVEDHTRQNVLAYEIFGGASKEVSQFLGMSTEEMAKARREAHSLGLVMGKDGLEASNKFKVGVENLKAQVAAIGREIAVNVMPILNDSLLPLIQEKIIPAFKVAAEAVASTARSFAALSPEVQSAAIIIGGLVAAAGPILLLFGKLVSMGKNLALAWGVLTKAVIVLKGEVLLFGGFLKGVVLWVGKAAVAIGGFGVAAVAAIAALTALWFWAGKIEKETEKLNTQAEEMHKRSKALIDEKKSAKELYDEYVKLRGSQDFDPTELERRKKAYLDAAIATDIAIAKETEFARLGKKFKGLTDEQTKAIEEKTRARLAATLATEEETGAVRKSEWQIAQEKKANEEAAQKAATLAKQRKDDLAALVKEHRDSIDQMTMSEDELLRKQEAAALAKAQALKATDAETDIIAESFYLKRKELMDKEAEEERKAVEEKEKIRAAADKEWENRLLQQSGNRQRILAAEYAQALAEAVESGASIAKVEEYYANERAKMQEEAERPWKEKLAEQGAARKKALAEQSGDARTILEAELADRQAKLQAAYADAIAEAGKSGADKALIDQYYENEMTALAEEGARQRTEIRKREVEQAAAFVVSSVGKLGSVLAGFSQNEQKRVERDYKQRKEALDAHFDAEEARIKASVADEKERDAQLSALEEQRSARSTALQEEAAAKKLELQRADAKREKALGIFNAVINTAQAVVSALKAGPVMGPIMAGVIGALGAAEIGVIASTPEPFEAGAMIQGGRGGVHGLVGEGKQDELILPMETGVKQLARELGSNTPASTYNYSVNVNVGTLIGNKQGIQELGRKIQAVIVNENKRIGVS